MILLQRPGAFLLTDECVLEASLERIDPADVWGMHDRLRWSRRNQEHTFTNLFEGISPFHLDHGRVLRRFDSNANERCMYIHADHLLHNRTYMQKTLTSIAERSYSTKELIHSQQPIRKTYIPRARVPRKPHPGSPKTARNRYEPSGEPRLPAAIHAILCQLCTQVPISSQEEIPS